MLSHLRFGKELRPLVFAGTFRRWFLWPLMRITRSVEVPDMQRGKGESIRNTVRMMNAVIDDVKSGDSFLIYPSGRLQRGSEEFIGGARIVSEIIKRCPRVNVVLVRTTGLWGSMFSCARTGDLPNLGRAFVKSIGWLLAGGLLFVPKREVSLHVEVLDLAGIPGLDRRTLNNFLEDWYNVSGGHTPVFVRYNRVLGPRRGKFAPFIVPATTKMPDSMIDNHP